MLPTFITKNVFFKLLSHADWLSTVIFFGLLIVSYISWYLFIRRFLHLRQLARELNYARQRLDVVVKWEELEHLAVILKKTDTGDLLNIGLKRIDHIHNPIYTLNAQDTQALVSEQLAADVDETVEQLVRAQSADLSLIKISAESGPLVGLFGTVWGLIHAFNRISERQTADIPTVAPGIAEALVVTLTGLFVAIPALIQYVILSRALKNYAQDLEYVAQKIRLLTITMGIIIKPSIQLSEHTKKASEYYETSKLFCTSEQKDPKNI